MYKHLAIVMAAWVILFSLFTHLGLVVCVGQNGHLAVEVAHEGSYNAGPAEANSILSHDECGDCSDTPVFSFYGRVRMMSSNRDITRQAVTLTADISTPSGATAGIGSNNSLPHTIPITLQYSLTGTSILLC